MKKRVSEVKATQDNTDQTTSCLLEGLRELRVRLKESETIFTQIKHGIVVP
jgi:hypothetical protein